MPPIKRDRNKVFVSHSHKDIEWLDRVQVHLKELTRRNLVDLWDDTRIQAGAQWRNEISDALNSASVAVLLVSADFIASDFIADHELPPLLAAAEKDGVRILALILSPSRFEKIESLSKYQTVNPPSKPIAGLSIVEREAYLVKLSDDVLLAIKESSSKSDEAGLTVGHSVSNLPFPPTQFFTGRKDVLSELSKNFEAGEVVVSLNGLSGVGKTQTALQYARENEKRYQNVFWANAGSLTSDYAALAVELNLCGKDEKNEIAVAKAFKQWTERNSGWLLILDDAEDYHLTREFIPDSRTGHVLLTTPKHINDEIASPIQLNMMSPQEGAHFLLKRLRLIKPPGAPLDAASPDLRTTTEKLSIKLDGLPLALERAAAYISENRLSLEDYLEHFETKRIKLLSKPGYVARSNHRDSVLVTISLSFTKVLENNPASADILCLCAFLDADSIPEEIFQYGVDSLKDPLEFKEAIAEGLNYSLLYRNEGVQSYSIPRLVQLAIRHLLDDDQCRLWAERAVRAMNKVFPRVSYTNWLTCGYSVQHAFALSEAIRKYNFTFDEATELLNRAGKYLLDRARCDEAWRFFEQSREIYEKTLGPEHSKMAFVLNLLAGVKRSKGELIVAELLYRQSRSIYEKAGRAEGKEYAEVLNNLADLYRLMRKYSEAESLLKRSLAIDESLSGEDSSDVAVSLNNPALLYKEQGKYEEAESHYLRSLQMKEKKFGHMNPSTAITILNLADLYKQQGAYPKAELHYERCIEIFENLVGDEHPKLPEALHNFAHLFQLQEKRAEAAQLYKRSLDLYAKVLGAYHPDYLQARKNFDDLAKSLSSNRLRFF